jgi:hypothetical protein
MFQFFHFECLCLMLIYHSSLQLGLVLYGLKRGEKNGSWHLDMVSKWIHNLIPIRSHHI